MPWQASGALERKIRAVAAAEGDATAKQAAESLLRAQKRLIEAEIARVQALQREERAAKRNPGPVLALSLEPTSRNVIDEYGSGSPVDVMA